MRTWMSNAKRMKDHKKHKGITNSKEVKHEKQEEQRMAQVGTEAPFYCFFW
jgi:hypothetical protein